MTGDRHGLKRKTASAGLSLALSLLVTTAHHVGHSEYRGQLLPYPEIGALAANVPTALTGNPSVRWRPTSPCTSARWCTRTKLDPHP